MQSILYVNGSAGAGNASLMTVQTVRAPGAAAIAVNTVSQVPNKFYGSMGTPHTFTDPITSEVITVISDATAVDFAGSVSGSAINIDAIAPGYTDLGSKVGDIIIVRPITEWANNIKNILAQSHNDDGSLQAAAITYNPNIGDYVQSGGIWSLVSGLNGAMTALTVWQGGYKGTIAALASRAYTASKDTYVDVLRTISGYTNTFALVYTEVTNGATAPALAANSVRLAKVVTSGSTITSVIQTGLDGINNSIYPTGGSKPDYNVVPNLMMPGIVSGKEYAVGEIEISAGVFKTLYFLRWNSSVANAQEFAVDPTYPNGAPTQIVQATASMSGSIQVPFRSTSANFIEWSVNSTSTRMLFVKDGIGSYSGNGLTLNLWYYK